MLLTVDRFFVKRKTQTLKKIKKIKIKMYLNFFFSNLLGVHMCEDGSCIYNSWLCDGENDCPGADDEENCQGIHAFFYKP